MAQLPRLKVIEPKSTRRESGLLRQKRAAAARKKYNLLQGSSTSDSDLTCDSSTSSSEDAEEVSGSSETITAEIPGHLDPGFLASDKTSAGKAPLNEEINIASSDSEVEIVGVQEHARWVHPQGGVTQCFFMEAWLWHAVCLHPANTVMDCRDFPADLGVTCRSC